MAYNAGRRARTSGLTWESLTPQGVSLQFLTPTPAERRVLDAQGPAFFSRWALRGYFEP